MVRKFLEGLGLEKDIIDQIMKANGDDINELNKKVETLQADITNNKSLLDEANKEIDSYKSMDIETIKKNAEDYKTKYEIAEQEHQTKLAEIELNGKLEKFVGSQNLKNDIYKKALVEQIKEKGLKFDNDTLLGGEDLVKGFKEQYADAFVDTKAKPYFADTTQGAPTGAISKEVFKKMSYNQRVELKKNSPQEYESLKD